MTGNSIGRILLVDDDGEHLGRLAEEVRRAAEGRPIDVVSWKPESGEDVLARFEAFMGATTTLVVTDYDLTLGPAGFFGTSIVSWCQQLAIPVGNYSRGRNGHLPKQPSLFEFRFSETPRQAAPQIVNVLRGFMDVRAHLEANPNLLSEPSPANMLAAILDHQDAISQFSLYAPQIMPNPGLIELFNDRKEVEGRKSLAAYILGHLLFNSILRYPGPIADPTTLCSYFAVADGEYARIAPLLAAARYDGPFREMDDRFWCDGVDAVIEGLATELGIEYEGSMAEYRRAVVEARLESMLERHPCPRCAGQRGGFRCPFTNATVCELGDCSVSAGASGWLPQGADLVRVERGYYDEIAPMMGR